MEIIKLQPAYKDYLWGGTKLKEKYGKHTKLSIVAESWELSAHKDGLSIVDSGAFKGMSFKDVIQQDKSLLGLNAMKFDEFPLLIKFIDAKDKLSIQVHPDDVYAQKVEKEFGKNEAWYIIDCEEGSYIYFGVNKNLTKEELREAIQNNTLTDYLNKVYVKKGDCFYVEAGTIHAIGKGIVIYEIQQNSNSTYRVYDYNRVGVDNKPRELHIDKALDVSKLEISELNLRAKSRSTTQDFEFVELVKTPYFTCNEVTIHTRYKGVCTEDSFHAISVIEGKGTIQGNSKTLEMEQGDTLFVPANFGEYAIDGACTVLQAYIEK